MLKYIIILDKYILNKGGVFMGFKKWVVKNYDKELAKDLSAECDVDPIVALIATARGYTDYCEFEQFISDEPYFSDPYQMADIEKAAKIIRDTIEKNEKIAIYGDYDCDGVCAVAILKKYFNSLGTDSIYYIPDRFSEGYGMNCDAVKYLSEQDVKLIITVDNGIACFEEIELAKQLGMKVVITDHHLPKGTLPHADAVVNPHRSDCASEFKEICGAEVAFRLICVLEDKEPEELLWEYADILATAVVADVMPLKLENRSIVKAGIDKIKENSNVGISALLNVSAVKKDNFTSTRIAFSLTPRINAAGRMGKADRAVELLLCENMMEALVLANEIDDENSRRQRLEKEIFASCIEKIEKDNLKYDRVIVVSGENWHHGVIGITAARIAERYGAPVILLSSDGDILMGSARSVPGFNIFDAISSCEDLLIKFGGHSQAAGITISVDNIDAFRDKINLYADKSPFTPPQIQLDCKLNPQALSLDLAFALSVLEPYGTENPTPLFGVYGVKLERITPMSNNKHLRLLFSKGANSFQTLLFGVSSDDFCFNVGDVLDLAVTVEPNLYNGEYTVSVLTKAIRLNGTDDDKLFMDLAAFNAFCSGKEYIVDNLLPTRSQVGQIYKKVLENPISEDKLKYLFLLEIGLGKTLISLKVLCELGLIFYENGRYKSVASANKTDLLNSKTFKILTERSGNNA